MPADIETWKMSTDEKYLFNMAVAVSTGVCAMDLANKKPGHIHHARWLTKASRILRLYVASKSPTRNLITLATYIIRVYVPQFFNIKFRYSSVYGSVHFSQFIMLSRYLPNHLFNVVTKVLADNAYFAHPENVLLAMIFDRDPGIRLDGYDKILEARQNIEVGNVREYVLPKINFDCMHYVDMINWTVWKATEPAFTRSMSHDEIMQFRTSNRILNDLNIPCHNQATERYVKDVSETTQAVSTLEKRDAMILAKLESREKRPRSDSKKDFK